METKRYKAILFDFGNTLADEFYFRKDSSVIPNFSKLMKKYVYDSYYADPSGNNILNSWMKGDISKSDIAQIIAQKEDIAKEHIVNLMVSNCSNLIIYNQVLNFAKSLSNTHKTAIVTVNADIFNEIIVPAYKLDSIFNVIVNSCNIKSLSKADICMDALRKLNIKANESLLIDNTLHCCNEFKNIGGNSYHFQSEERFVTDFSL